MISHDTSSIFGDAFEWGASFDCILKADGWATFCRCLTRKSGPLKLCLHKIRFFQSPLTAFYDQCLKLGILVSTILLVFKLAIKKKICRTPTKKFAARPLTSSSWCSLRIVNSNNGDATGRLSLFLKLPIAGFHSCDERACFSTKTKENVCIRIGFNSRMINWGDRHGRWSFV